jgi:O-antigen ligase
MNKQLPDKQPKEPDSKISTREVLSKYGVVILIIAHVPLGLMVYRSSTIATIHALIALGFGLIYSLSGRNIHRVAYAASYIVGGEVLWRMTEANINWEFGKYALVAMMVVAILRKHLLRGPALPLAYIVLLIPSSMLTFMELDLNEARKAISFNLSGPLALMVCAWFFYNLRLTHEQLRRIFLSMIGPLVAVGTVTLFGVVTNENLTFSGSSNLATSGGFGPNQVSAALGMGALVAFLCVLDKTTSWLMRAFAFVFMVFLAVQCALTFSRGGLYNAVGASVFASFYLMRDSRSRTTLILVGVVVFVIGRYVVLPQLSEFTGGAIEARFQNIDLTKRDRFVQANLEQWLNSPILGVGPGQSWVMAHTEFTRLLAEHGILGLAAILLLLILGAKNVIRVRDPRSKAIVVALISWSFLFMLNAGMRLVGPSFMVGLTCLTLLPQARFVLRQALPARLRTTGWTVLMPPRFAKKTL